MWYSVVFGLSYNYLCLVTLVDVDYIMDPTKNDPQYKITST